MGFCRALSHTEFCLPYGAILRFDAGRCKRASSYMDGDYHLRPSSDDAMGPCIIGYVDFHAYTGLVASAATHPAAAFPIATLVCASSLHFVNLAIWGAATLMCLTSRMGFGMLRNWPARSQANRRFGLWLSLSCCIFWRYVDYRQVLGYFSCSDVGVGILRTCVCNLHVYMRIYLVYLYIFV